MRRRQNVAAATQSYRVVQLNFTPEIEAFYRLFDRSLSIISNASLKQHIHSVPKIWTTFLPAKIVHISEKYHILEGHITKI